MHSAKRRGYLETQSGQPINDEMLARLSGTFKDDLYRLKEELISNGIPSVEESTGIWFNRRMVKDTEKSDKCADAGKRGGGNPTLSTQSPSHSLSDTNSREERTDNQIPDTRSHISLKVPFKGECKGVKDFESFWSAYPKRKSKGQAIKAFEKAIKLTTIDVILASLKNLSESADWIKEGGKYIPHPSTWLNAQGWEDQVLLNFSKSGLPVPSQEELKAMGPKWGTNRAE